MTKTVLIAAGGTGGHVFPAVSVAERLHEDGFRPVFVTDRRGYRIIHSSAPSFTIHRIMAASPYGSTASKRLAGMTQLGLGLLHSVAIMLWHRPAAVIGFGGYPSVAPVMLGHFMGRATLLHEQNAFFGRANRFLARFVQTIALSWAETANIPAEAVSKTALTGMPVREAFSKTGQQGYTPPGDGVVNLLIVGGSLGARVFGDTVPEAISRLPAALKDRLRVTHQVRQEQIKEVEQCYRNASVKAEIMPFITDMPRRMQAAHLVIGRAGASSVAELAASGRPAILVPLPQAMDDHQTANAETVVEAGGGWCIPETEMSAGSLAGRIASLLDEPSKLSKAARCMLNLEQHGAAEAISQRIRTIINGDSRS